MEGRTKVRFFFNFSNFLFRKKIGLQKYVVPIKKVTLKAPFSKYYETSLDKVSISEYSDTSHKYTVEKNSDSCSDLKKKKNF